MSLRLLRSVRFNIFLFLVIAGACALGTFLPQAGEVPEKVQEFLVLHPSLGPVLERLGLFNLFYSTWFMALLGLMAFDIVVCKLHRKPPDPGLVRLPQEEDEKPLAETALLAKPFRGRLGSPLPLEMAAAAAGGVLGARGYAVEVSRAQGKVLVTGTRHRLQRWGSYVSHVSLVVILLGALVKALFGFEEMLPILEGTSRVMKHQPWEVFVDRFEMKTYPGTRTPSLFASDLRVVDVSMEALAQAGDFEDGKLLAKKRIVVNDPVSVPVGPFFTPARRRMSIPGVSARPCLRVNGRQRGRSERWRR